MDSKSEFENKIIDEIKELIISDSSLTYGERNSFDRFILRINQNKTFEDAVGQLLRNLERLESKEIQPLGLTAGAKKIFNQLYGRYDIAQKKRGIYFLWGGFNEEEKYCLVGLDNAIFNYYCNFDVYWKIEFFL